MKAQLSDRALRDLASIETYWLPRDPTLYRNLTTALENALEFLIATPFAGSRVENSGIRKWRIGRTPFLLFYILKQDILFVARLRHERENWRQRP